MDTTFIKSRAKKEKKKKLERCRDKQAKLISTVAEYPASAARQFATLYKRSFFDYIKVYSTPLNFFQIIAISIIAGLLWFRRPFHVAYLRDITGGLFFTSIFAGGFFSAFVSLFNFPKERNIITRERAEGTYRLSLYFLAKMIAESPFAMVFPFLFGLVMYLLCGYRAHASSIFGFFGTLMIAGIASAGFGTMISAGVKDPPKAPVIATVALLFFMIISGFYVDLNNFPKWISWISYLSFFKYTYDGVLDSQFIGFQIPQDPSLPSQFSNYTNFIPGEAITHSQYSYLNGSGYNILILAGVGFIFRSIAFAVLFFTL